MRPEGTRVLRREQRHAWRGLKRGRHVRPVRTAYGAGQERAARAEWWREFFAARRAVLAGDGQRAGA